MNEIVKKNAIQFGLTSGIIAVITETIMYLNLELHSSIWIGIIIKLFYIILGIYLLAKTKKEMNGDFSFKDAFTTYFIYAIIGISISVAFNIILYNFVDPAAKDTLKEISIKSAVHYMEKFGTPSSVIKESIAKMEQNDQFAIWNQIQGSLISILISAIFGLILAAVFKSKSTNQL